MKSKLWLFQIPFVVLSTGAFLITDFGMSGRIESKFQEKLYKKLQWAVSGSTDLKFKIRGPTAPRNNIVIVEVDGPAVDKYGRWPWHRNVVANLIDNIFASGAKVVGMDMTFSEKDERVPPELAAVLAKNNLGVLANQFETDLQLVDTYKRRSAGLVTGWTSDSACRPLYDNDQAVLPEAKAAWDKAYKESLATNTPPQQDEKYVGVSILCPVTNPQALDGLPPDFDRFGFTSFIVPGKFDPDATPFMSAVTTIANLDELNAVSTHTGYFNAFPDEDGVIRKTPLFIMLKGKPQPSLALEMARVATGDDLALELDAEKRVKSLRFMRSGREIPVNSGGNMEINWRGGDRTFKYVSAADLLDSSPVLKDELNRKLAGVSKAEVLKDALVYIGVTAIGTNDMRSFPFDSNVAGVEGHATILDNLLSGDPLIPGSRGAGSTVVLLLMVVGAMLFAYATQKLESIPALLLFLGVFSGIGITDVKILFERNHINWNTGYLYVELFSIFIFTLAVKYVLEERSKKFVKGAFAKYVAPAVVDSILKDPAKLQVGGEKKELTIMFSDIRSFTTFSERMDAKALAKLLNDYLGIMTGIVFANEGTLDKYIGDAIMAFWGAPLDQSKHAANACKTAIMMMKALGENKERFKTEYGVDVNIGVGINSGMVNVGNMGSTQNFAYTVIGDHVNLASRLEGLTKEYRCSILTTRFTFDDITAGGEQLPPHRVLDHVKVKGKKNAVELIQVLHEDLDSEGLKSFDEGRALYEKQQWDAAIAKFQEASKLIGKGKESDGPSEMYVERCEEFKRNPPEKDWDGSWEMHSK
jgi:adenylate cyclase